MQPALQHLLSFENAFNKRFASHSPLYKFHRLYEDRTSLSEEERKSRLFVENENKTGFHVLNAFFVSLLRQQSIWFAPSTEFNDPWDAGGAVSILRTNATIEESVLKLLFGEEQFEEIALLPDQNRYEQVEAGNQQIANLPTRDGLQVFTDRIDVPAWNERGRRFHDVPRLADKFTEGSTRFLRSNLIQARQRLQRAC
jgi:hypothetical protein